MSFSSNAENSANSVVAPVGSSSDPIVVDPDIAAGGATEGGIIVAESDVFPADNAEAITDSPAEPDSIPPPSVQSAPEADQLPEGDATEIKGDPEAAVVYLRRLMPTFAQLYQSTMLLSVR